MTENNSNDIGDAWGTIGDRVVQPKIARMPVERYASEYNMSHSKRGIALIFNHEIFEIPNLKPRAGTNVDCDNLCKALTQIHFDVKLYKDLRLREMMQRIEEVSKWDHADEDCILIAILSHGEMGYIYARDCQYKLDNIWGYFTATQCPTLAGKPKLFFIQACQGDQLDAGVTLINHTETDSGDYAMSYKIPIHADFLIAYSTIPGFYSWRNTTKGSWFMQSLCHELIKNGKRYDILTLLTFVCQRVAIDFGIKENMKLCSINRFYYSNQTTVGINSLTLKVEKKIYKRHKCSAIIYIEKFKIPRYHYDSDNSIMYRCRLQQPS